LDILKNFLNNLTKGILAISLTAVIFSGVISLEINSRALYLYGFQKYQVGTTTGLSQTELNKAASGLISYFNSSEEFINLTVTENGRTFPLFNEREIIHLKDVKGIIQLDYRVLEIGLAYILCFILWTVFSRPRKWWELAGGVFGGSALTLGLMAVLGIVSAINFNWLFYQFHYISFANDFWLLDPATDYLIMLFPGGFWFDAFLYCVIAAAVISVILGVGSWRYLAYSKKQETSR
jgi:integral membrane protein (TIGR01906 family)